MALTGRAGRPPLGPPALLVDKLRSIGATLADLAGGVTPDPLLLLGERAAILGLHRQGAVSCSGATRLVPTGDGWLAVTLARDDDVAMVAAWLELDGPPADPWWAIDAATRRRSKVDLEHRAQLLGLPVTSLPDRFRLTEGADSPFAGLPVTASAAGPSAPIPPSGVTVVDLSALWAGPLCGHLLGLAGANVIKVESTGRPDGARRGPAAFFDLMNGGKASVALDFRAEADRGALRRLIASCDIVIEASRPRALRQLGVLAEEQLASPTGPRLWISITGHGPTGTDGDRVAFGDDAAVGGGLVAWDADGPCFCSDAIADPTTGVVAATAALAALAHGGRWRLDVAMTDVAAYLSGPPLDATGWAHPVAPPRSRVPGAAAAPLGQDTLAVLGQLAS